ncbi:hypothetical protein ACTWJ8_20595 [Streptomyces sp. SDT5-1]|uniref:hypothetical protein n=1 Tax=Streptomyces sp. SDT5-1 TaxID=3406418 RepID=UPI003FCF3142
MPNEELQLIPGTTITTRAEVQEAYGGADQGGIVPAVRSSRVFVYSDHESGAQYGYTFDGRAADDEFGPLFLYTGAGTVGDQHLGGVNGSLLNHAAHGREAHLFVADGFVEGTRTKWQRYIGQVVVDPIEPFEVRWNHDSEGNLRRVVVFRLRAAPGHTLVFDAADSAPMAPGGVEVAPPGAEGEQHLWSKFGAALAVTPGIAPPEKLATDETLRSVLAAERQVVQREALLRTRFEAFLEAQGHEYGRLRLPVEGRMLRTDTYDQTGNVLYEAKGRADREAVRLAVGQLLDYRRHAARYVDEGLKSAVLLPEDPGQDLRDLIESSGLHLIFADGEGFSGYPVG